MDNCWLLPELLQLKCSSQVLWGLPEPVRRNYILWSIRPEPQLYKRFWYAAYILTPITSRSAKHCRKQSRLHSRWQNRKTSVIVKNPVVTCLKVVWLNNNVKSKLIIGNNERVSSKVRPFLKTNLFGPCRKKQTAKMDVITSLKNINWHIKFSSQRNVRWWRIFSHIGISKKLEQIFLGIMLQTKSVKQEYFQIQWSFII